MYCDQCEQTPASGCTRLGVCGKDEDLASLQDTLLMGLKGLSAYATHARSFGRIDPAVDGVVHAALYSTLTNVNFDVRAALDMALEVGDATVRILRLLDQAHVERFGVPEPIRVTQDRVEGHSLLVSGHDLKVLEALLEATAGKGINVYTHSELLPAHGYPGLKRFSHLKGHVGKAWHEQKQLFESFPGAILVTTNCVMPIRKGSYEDRMWTIGLTGVAECPRIVDMDFKPLIEKALSLPPADQASDKMLLTGFHHENVLALAPDIVAAVKAGQIRRFFVIAGCDAPTPGREYFRELALALPEDCVLLTTSCGKFRFNDVDFGTVPGTGVPRYLDLGQCNNSGSAVIIAQALGEAFDCPIADLPLSIVLSWFEQKAVAILLGLLSLGIKHVHVGPSLPHFLSPGVVKLLGEAFDVQLISGHAKRDLARMLGEATLAR